MSSSTDRPFGFAASIFLIFAAILLITAASTDFAENVYASIAPVAVSAVAVAGVVVLNRKTLRSLSVKLKTAHEVKQ